MCIADCAAGDVEIVVENLDMVKGIVGANFRQLIHTIMIRGVKNIIHIM